MNWGYGITLLTLSFVAFMTFLVISAFRQSFDLVTEDYYGKELLFQSHIDKQYNHQQLHGNMNGVLVNGQLIISFPKEFESADISGNIVLFCPSDARKDFSLPIRQVNGFQTVDLTGLRNGFYRLQIDYMAGGKSYYFEQELKIQ